MVGAGTGGGLEDGALLDRRDAAGHADDHTRLEEAVGAVDLADEVLQHRFGDVEVRDDTILERADGGDGAGGLAEHLLGAPADGLAVVEDLVGALVDGDHAGLVEHNALAADGNKRVARAQVDPHVDAEHASEQVEHVRFDLGKAAGRVLGMGVAAWHAGGLSAAGRWGGYRLRESLASGRVSATFVGATDMATRSPCFAGGSPSKKPRGGRGV